ncbi:T9SS type A sorting domain-containing protein, partial [bacterium]|nr:T9SS type A sorting domain-containing protein [bacterium]
PKGGSRFYQNVKTTPILIVEGFVSQGLVKQENVGIALNGMQVRVRNLNNQQDANNTTGTVSGDGRYVVILMDFLRNAAAQTGDVLELTVFDPTGTYSVESIRHPLSASEIKAHIVSLNDIRMRMLPKQSALLQNYPNPFNPETWIPYQLSSASEVAIQIYDIAGHFVRTLFLGNQPAGYYQKKHRAAYWDGHNEHGEQIASGVYFYTLRAGTFHATRKFTLMK